MSIAAKPEIKNKKEETSTKSQRFLPKYREVLPFGNTHSITKA